MVADNKAASVNMPYVIERWPGGMLTNFPTIRKAVKKMATIDKLITMVLILISLRRNPANLPSTCQVGQDVGFYR